MPAPRAAQWQPVERSFTGPELDNPYTDLDATVIFTRASGATVSRPLFWDGDRTWRARLASTHADGSWTWRVRSSTGHELASETGELVVDTAWGLPWRASTGTVLEYAGGARTRVSTPPC